MQRAEGRSRRNLEAKGWCPGPSRTGTALRQPDFESGWVYYFRSVIFDTRNGLAEAMEATGQRKPSADQAHRIATRLVRLLKARGWSIKWTRPPLMIDGLFSGSKPH